jgi:FdrA protein
MSDDRPTPLLAAPARVVSVGLALFAETLMGLGVPVIHVEWQPPAGGDSRLADLLTRIADD